MDNPYVIWAFVCFGVALILFVLELVVPSGGLLGLGAATAAIAGVVLLFQVNWRYGVFSAIACLVALPFLIGYGLKILPHTPFWRMLTLQSNTDPDVIDPADADPNKPNERKQLVGAVGEALTDLRPIGACRINGRRVECLAQGGVIRAGANVQVVAADGLQIKVREES